MSARAASSPRPALSRPAGVQAFGCVAAVGVDRAVACVDIDMTIAINVGMKNSPMDIDPSTTRMLSNTTIATRDRKLAVSPRIVKGSETSSTGIAMTMTALGPSFDSSDTRLVVRTPVELALELVPKGTNSPPAEVSAAISAAEMFHRVALGKSERIRPP